MDSQGSLVKGAVSVSHQIQEGKHQYKVQNVVKFKKSGGESFARKGDTLLQINGVHLEDLTPEMFAEMLTTENPSLVVHQASRMKEAAERTCPEESAFLPVSKETTLLCFSLEMRREEDLEEDREEDQSEDSEERADVCPSESWENGQEGDLLVVSLTNTSISVVVGRGCDDVSPSHPCDETGCNFNKVVMVTGSSTVTLVPRGTGNFKKEKQVDNISIEHVPTQHYLRSVCLQNTPYISPNPEKITIYYYKSECVENPFRGIPVVLNFTDSNCFLKCCSEGARVLLRVEPCEKHKLKLIPRGDTNMLAFIFYMKSTIDRHRRFESAVCPGWFIHVVNTDTVEMETLGGQAEDPSFYFIIQK